MGATGSDPGRARLHWWGTLLYIPILYGAGWLAARPLALFFPGWRIDQVDLAGAAIALVLLLATLPWRLRRTWSSTTPWSSLGLARPIRQALLTYLRGLLKALLLLGGVCAALLLLGLARWGPPPTWGEWLNAAALAFGVGFAEELLFRSWLMGELTLLMGASRALLLQAVLFSLLHNRFQLPPTTLVPLLVGLLMLGLALGLQRSADGGALWGAIGLHGGLVGGWFALSQGWLQIAPATPTWLIGGSAVSANPIGGLLGLLGLFVLLLSRRRWW
ncbi:MAG: lysostaphin resistance A-like protein [Cyanobium sp.]